MSAAAQGKGSRPDGFESLLSLLGGRGRHACLTLAGMILLNTYPASVTLSFTFANAPVNFSCDVNASLDASAAACWAVATDDQCSIDLNCSHSASRLPCRRWTFDTSTFASTIASRFQLACSAAGLADLSATIFFAGFLVGSSAYGLLSDAIGRQKALLLSICDLTAFGVAAALLPQYWMFAVAMAMAGVGTGGMVTIIFTLAAECTDAKNRFTWCIAVSVGWVLGVFLATLVSYLTRSSEQLLLWLSASAAVHLPLAAAAGESARWLVSTRRLRRAQAAVLRVARINGAVQRLPPDFSVDEVAPGDSAGSGGGGGGVFDLFRTPGMRRVTLLGWVHWFAASMTYYGISLGAASFGGNIFVNALLVSAVEMPARVIGMCVTACGVGRKPVLYASFLLSALLLAAMAATYQLQHLLALRIALAVVSKLAITVAFDFVWLYYAELYPTVIRTAGVGSGSTMARLGAMASTQMLPLGSYWQPLPFVIFGVGPFVACLVVYFLPETSGRRLPETIADGEKYVSDSGRARVSVADDSERRPVYG